MRKAVIIIGPPGAGKGTQAELLASNVDFFHFDTGRYVAQFIEKKRSKHPAPPKTKRGKTEYEEGLLTDPMWVLKLIAPKITKLAKADLNLVFSGSPRTILEAFGDRKTKGIIPYLTESFGKKNITVFHLNISREESIKRNSERVKCSLCQKIFFSRKGLKQCPLCRGKLIKRFDDKVETLKRRLEEYRTRTEPVIRELKNHKFKLIKVDGTPSPEIIFNKIVRHLQ